MDEHLLRLTWALPLVLILGVAALLLLKKWGVAAARATVVEAPELLATTAVSEHTKVMLVRHQGRQMLLVESSAAQLQVVPDHPGPSPTADWSRGSWVAAMRRPRG